MMKTRASWLIAGVAVCSLCTVNWASAQKAPEKSADELTAEMIDSLALAAELAAFGRGELADATGVKDFKSPEALVAAGGILLRIHKQTGGKSTPADAKVMDDEGKPVAEPTGPTESFADEAAALFDEARALPSKDKAALEAQIKQAQTVPERGVIVGPKVVSRVIAPGRAHSVHVAVKPNGVVAVQGTGKTHFQAVAPGGKVVWNSHGPRGVYTGGGNVHIKAINGGPAAKYKVIAN